MPTRAQSESIGVILLTGVIVLTVGAAGTVVFASVGADDTTRADVSITLSDDGVAVAHDGGAPVAFADLDVVVRHGNGTWRPAVNESSVLNSDGDGQFDPGEHWVEWRSLDRSEITTVSVFDTDTDTLLAETRQYPSDSAGLTPPPEVTVAAPNGGETFMGGKSATVEWNASQIDSGIERVDIAYSTDGGSSWSTVATDLPNNGSYEWTVPTVESDDALVRVTAVDTEGTAASDTSDATFSISRTGLSEESVSDLASGTAGQEQTIAVTADTELPANESVVVDLSDAQSVPNGTVEQVDYRDAAGGDSRVTVDANETNAVVEFTPDSAIAAGETVSFNVTGVDTADDYTAVHTAEFGRSDGNATDSATFVVVLTGDANFNSDESGDVYTEDNVTVSNGAEIDGNVTAGGDVTINEGSIEGNVTSDGDVTLNEAGTINGTVSADGTVTVNEDGTLNGNAESNGTVTVGEGGAINGDLESGSSIDLEGPVDGNVSSDGDVTLKEGGEVDGNVTSDGAVTVNEDGGLNGSITSEDNVTVNNGSSVGGGVETNGSVDISAPIQGNVTSGGSVTLNEGGSARNVDADGDVTVKEDGTVKGNVTSDGTVTVNDGGTIEGDVYVDSADDIQCEEGATINGLDCETYVEENY